MMADSTVNKIKNQVIDYVVSENTAQINSATDKQGIINVIVNDDELNALYVGNTHIASGYGFDKKEDKAAVEELLTNPNIQKLLDDSLITNEPEESSEEDDIPVSDLFSEVNIRDVKLTLDENGLKAETFITVSDIQLTLSDDTILSENNIYSVFDNLTIKRIDFNYNIKSDSETPIYYIVDTTLTDNCIPANFDVSNSTELTDLNYDGKNHHCQLDVNIDLSLQKDYSKVIQELPINLIFSDSEPTMWILKQVSKIKYEFPIYAATSNVTLTNVINSYTDKCLYDDLYGAELSFINSESEKYSYLFIPTQLIENNGVAIIFKKSNVGCDFNKVSTDFINIDEQTNVPYDKYCSPWPYKGATKWIIK